MAVTLVTPNSGYRDQQYIGLSGDTKPTLGTLDVGSTFRESDTDHLFLWGGAAWFQSEKGGSVSSVSTGYTTAVSFTRPNDTPAAYSIQDVVGTTTTAGGAVLTFALMGPSGGNIAITGASLEIDIATVSTGMAGWKLWLFGVTPPSNLGDHGLFTLPAGDIAGAWLGEFIQFETPIDYGDTISARALSLPRYIKLVGTSIFAYLSTDGSYSPSASIVKKITIHTVAI
jgi:hypothetical protein